MMGIHTVVSYIVYVNRMTFDEYAHTLTAPLQTASHGRIQAVSSPMPDVATATPVAIGEAAAAAATTTAAAAELLATFATAAADAADAAAGDCIDVTLPIRVTDGSRFGGTIGLLGGIGGGTPRPSGSVAGVFLMVDMLLPLPLLLLLLFNISLPANCGCCVCCT